MRGQKYEHMLTLNVGKQEEYARAALLNQDPISIELSKEDYREKTSGKVVWIDGKKMRRQTFLSNRMFVVTENSFVYETPNKDNPIGYVYAKESYFDYDKSWNDGAQWYGIKIDPSQVIYNR